MNIAKDTSPFALYNSSDFEDEVRDDENVEQTFSIYSEEEIIQNAPTKIMKRTKRIITSLNNTCIIF